MGKPTQVQLFPLDLVTKATNLQGLANGFKMLEKQITVTCKSVAITPEDTVTISVEAKAEGNLVITKVNENLAQDYPLFHQDPPEKQDTGDPPASGQDKPARKKKDKGDGKKQDKGKAPKK